MAVGVLTAFAFLWPMMMFDPDELSFVISSGAGELFEYAAGAAGAAFGLALVLMVIYLIFRKMMHTKSSAWIAGVILTIPALTGLLISQISFGNPGFYGEKSFVILKEQADLSSVKSITNPVERREAVYSALVKHAEANQMDIRGWLDSKGIAYKPYYLINAIELDAGPVLRAQLAQRNDVDRVLDSPILRPLRNEVPTAEGSDRKPDR